MVTKRRIAWTVYVLAVTALTVAAFQAGRAGACGNWCVNVNGGQHFSNGTIFFKGGASTACNLVLLAPTKSGGACYGTSGGFQFDEYPYGTPSCSAPLGTLVTATGVDGSKSGHQTLFYCCSSCN